MSLINLFNFFKYICIPCIDCGCCSKSRHKCNICYENFPYNDMLITHIHEVHSDIFYMSII